MASKLTPRKWLLIGAVSCAGLLVAAGCGSEETAAESGSPIDEYVGIELFGGFDSETAEQDFAVQQRESEEAISVCMKEEGFEYTPQDTESILIEFGDDELEWGSKEWTEKYGFGVSTQEFGQSQVGPELVGYDDNFTENESDFVDPNQEYLDSLDEAAQNAYNVALYGEEFSQEFDETIVNEESTESFEPSGCQGAAFEAMSSQFSFYEDFDTELEQLFTSTEEDPKVAEKIEEVRSCVKKAGYELNVAWPDTYNEDGESIYETELEEIRTMIGELEETTFDAVDFDSMSEEEIEAMFAEEASGPEFTPEATTKLAELQSTEIETAVAAFECDGSQDAMFELFRDVLRQYEEQFIETNKDKLDNFKAEQDKVAEPKDQSEQSE